MIRRSFLIFASIFVAAFCQAKSANTDFCVHSIKNGKFTSVNCKGANNNVLAELDAKVRARLNSKKITTQPMKTRRSSPTTTPEVTSDIMALTSNSQTAAPQEDISPTTTLDVTTDIMALTSNSQTAAPQEDISPTTTLDVTTDIMKLTSNSQTAAPQEDISPTTTLDVTTDIMALTSNSQTAAPQEDISPTTTLDVTTDIMKLTSNSQTAAPQENISPTTTPDVTTDVMELTSNSQTTKPQEDISPTTTLDVTTDIMALTSNFQTAAPQEVTHIILGRRFTMNFISLTATSFVDFGEYPVNITRLVVVDYDPVENYIYWTGNEGIHRVRSTETVGQTVVSNVSAECDGIAVDWVARNLYWTDKARGIIEVSRLDGNSRKTLVKTGIQFPRAIALDPATGNMYWSDWGRSPKIEAASLDGNDRRILVNDSIVWPNGIALDYTRKFLYWVDSFLDKIEAISLDGSTRILLAQFDQQIFGFTYFNHFLYWTDWQNGTLERMLVYDTTVRQSIAHGATDMMGIKAYGDAPIPGTNDCAGNNGGCSTLCFYTPKGVKCSCPDNYVLSVDLKTCLGPS